MVLYSICRLIVPSLAFAGTRKKIMMILKWDDELFFFHHLTITLSSHRCVFHCQQQKDLLLGLCVYHADRRFSSLVLWYFRLLLRFDCSRRRKKLTSRIPIKSTARVISHSPSSRILSCRSFYFRVQLCVLCWRYLFCLVHISLFAISFISGGLAGDLAKLEILFMEY